jgi:hypothetical protein
MHSTILASVHLLIHLPSNNTHTPQQVRPPARVYTSMDRVSFQTGRKNESSCSDREKDRESERKRSRAQERQEREAAREREREGEREERERKAGPQVATTVKAGVELRHLKSSGNPLIAPDSQEWKASEHLKRYTGRNMHTHTIRSPIMSSMLMYS